MVGTPPVSETANPERKATRELLKPGGLSGELPAGDDAGSVHPLERNYHS
jgi:hypothetical protein